MLVSPSVQVAGRPVPRVAIICDLLEENWPSMDLIGHMLEEGLQQFQGQFEAVRLCPQMRRRFTRGGRSEPKRKFNADRVLNRFWDYPRWLRMRRNEFDLFHIVDHSYAHLVHTLPPNRI